MTHSGHGQELIEYAVVQEIKGRHRTWVLRSLARCTTLVPKRNRGLAAIQLDVRGEDIIVDLPGTNYTVTYHKPGVSPQLLVSYLLVKDDPRTELTQAEFLARAWRL